MQQLPNSAKAISDDFQLVQRYSSDFHELTKFVEC